MVYFFIARSMYMWLFLTWVFMLSLLLSLCWQCLHWKKLASAMNWLNVSWELGFVCENLRTNFTLYFFPFFILCPFLFWHSAEFLMTCHFQFYLVFSANGAGYKFSFTVFILHVLPHAGHRSRTYFTLDLPLWMRQNMGLQSMLVRIISSQMEVAPLHYCSYHTEEKTIQEHKRDWKDVRGIVGRR